MKAATIAPVVALEADLSRGEAWTAPIRITRPEHKNVGLQAEVEETMTTIAMEEATATLGEAFPIVPTPQDHHQAVEEEEEAVEEVLGAMEEVVEVVEEADLDRTMVSRTSYHMGLAYLPLKQN